MFKKWPYPLEKIPAIRLSGSSEAKTSGPFFAAALNRSPPLLGTSDVMPLPKNRCGHGVTTPPTKAIYPLMSL